MKVTRNGPGTMAGPGDWFAGNVYIDVVSTPSPTSRVMGGIVHFAPGARTAWHTHPAGQTIFVTEGVGLVQREGGPVEEVRPGDRVSVGVEPGPGDLDRRELVDHETLGRPVALELFHDPARGGLTGQDAPSEGTGGCLPVEAVRLVPLRIGDLEVEHHVPLRHEDPGRIAVIVLCH
jgi:hypothetical protein